MSITYLTKEHFSIICLELKHFFNKLKDPPPVYAQTFFDRLESIIAIPQKTFGGQDLYKSLNEKAACYLYFITKLHPFNNGNKRISIVATYVFLKLNSVEFLVNENKMYDFAKKITNSHNKQDEEFKEVVKFIRDNSMSSTFLARLLVLMRLR